MKGNSFSLVLAYLHWDLPTRTAVWKLESLGCTITWSALAEQRLSQQRCFRHELGRLAIQETNNPSNTDGPLKGRNKNNLNATNRTQEAWKTPSFLPLKTLCLRHGKPSVGELVFHLACLPPSLSLDAQAVIFNKVVNKQPWGIAL